MHLRTVWWLLFVCGYWLAWPVWAAEIQVSVDRNPVNLNESFQITFSASAEPDGSPDFTPLRDNFEILNQQRSSNASWLNGKSSRSEQWILNVMAKQAGELLIPPVAFGADTSKPIKVVVSDAPVSASSDDEVFLEVQATPENPYVQSQVLYTLKLYRRVQITQASLNEPEIKDAVVEKLGEDSTYSTQVNGLDYWVTERKYAIFPQQSGVFTIAPLALTAEVVAAQRPRFNGFFNRQITETRRVSSKAVTLTVQPIPQEYKDPLWLSAQAVDLQQSWSDGRLQTTVGEPLTRTIRLTAKGTTVGQLPELAGQQTLDGIKTYPDQPVLNEDKQSDGLIAVREEKIAYIPSKAGAYTLPALTLSWFNTQTQKIEVARLPEVTIQALPAAGSAPPAVAAATETAQKASTATAAASSASTPISPAQDSVFWQGLAAFLAMGWLATLTAWFVSRKKQPIKPKAVTTTAAAIDDKALKLACRDNDPQAAKQAVLLWGKNLFAADSLTAIAPRCPEPLRSEILALNQSLYAAHPLPWQGQTLWQAFSQAQIKPQQRRIQDDPLQPLYRL